MSTRSVSTRTLSLSAAVTLGACHLAAGLPDYAFDDAAGGAGGAGTGGETTAPECESSDDCESTVCHVATCAEGVCALEVTPEAACTEGGGDTCDEEGACRKSLGRGCAVNGECLSGLCVDGVCCTGLCDGVCERCDSPGDEGTCLPEPAGSVCRSGLCDGTTSGLCASGQHRFSGAWGDIEEQEARALAFDADGGLWVAGFLDGTVDLGNGPGVANAEDAFVLHLDENGVFARAYRWSNPSFQAINAIAIDAMGRPVIAGSYVGDASFGSTALDNVGGFSAFLVQLDAMGGVAWQQDFMESSSPQLATNVVVLPSSGDILVGGQMRGTLSPLSSSTSQPDAWVMRFSAGGVFQWAQNWGDSSAAQTLGGLAADDNDDIYLVGRNHDVIDFGDGPIMNVSSTFDGYLARLDDMGATIWSRGLASPEDVFPEDVAVLPGGRVAVVGSFQGTMTVTGQPILSASPLQRDGFLLIFDASGSLVAHRVFGDAGGDDEVRAVAVDAVGNIALTGRFASQMPVGAQILVGSDTTTSDAFLIKLAPDLTPLWAKAFGDAPLDDSSAAVAFASDGRLAIAGQLRTNASFGGTSFTSQGGADFFVACFEP